MIFYIQWHISALQTLGTCLVIGLLVKYFGVFLPSPNALCNFVLFQRMYMFCSNCITTLWCIQITEDIYLLKIVLVAALVTHLVYVTMFTTAKFCPLKTYSAPCCQIVLLWCHRNFFLLLFSPSELLKVKDVINSWMVKSWNAIHVIFCHFFLSPLVW